MSSVPASLPTLGVGVTYFTGLDPVLETDVDLVNVLEVEPQTLWYDTRQQDRYVVDRAALERLASLPFPKLLHGVGFPVGGTAPPDRKQIPPLREMISSLGVPWISEHLSFNRARGPAGVFNTGFLLPPRQTVEGVQAAIRSIRAMADDVPIPLAVETGVSYLRRRSDELPDGEFVAAVVEGADCGIVLDLHNLWTNQRNGRQPVEDFLNEIPLERVWEVHLAGGVEQRGFWLDSHSGLVAPDLLHLATDVISRLPTLRAIIFELFPAYFQLIGPEAIRRQLAELHELWSTRRVGGTELKNHALRRRGNEFAPRDAPPSAAEWENTLGALVVGRHAEGLFAEEIGSDPGVALLGELVDEFRAGMVTTVLPLTVRLLLLCLGEDAVKETLRRYWRRATPELFASSEAAGFGAWLKGVDLAVPYLQEVLNYEEALVATLMDGGARVARFTHEPLPLVQALADGRLPDALRTGQFEIEVTGSRMGRGGAQGVLSAH